MDSGAERMVRLAMLTMMLMRFDFLRLLLRGMTQHLMQLHLMMLLHLDHNTRMNKMALGLALV
jgi:hypothetical protein